VDADEPPASPTLPRSIGKENHASLDLVEPGFSGSVL
jgi:hypothetical protein